MALIPRNYRGKCEIEKVMALDAKQFVETVIGHTVILENVNKGKYAGRVVALYLLVSGG